MPSRSSRQRPIMFDEIPAEKEERVLNKESDSDSADSVVSDAMSEIKVPESDEDIEDGSDGGPDYSEEWLAAMETSDLSLEDISYHYDLISALKTMEGRRYPSKLPPARPAMVDDDDVSESASSIVTSNNIFDVLADSDEEDDDETSLNEPIDDEGRRSTQVRYLLVQAMCGIADCISKSARDLIAQRDYERIVTLWEDAYAVLHEAKIFADPFMAVLWQAKEDHAQLLPDGHDYERVEEAMECLQQMATHALCELNDSVECMKEMRDRLLEIQASFEEKKKKLIAEMGIEAYLQSIRKPTLTYTKLEKKRSLRDEIDALHEAVEGCKGVARDLSEVVEDLDDFISVSE